MKIFLITIFLSIAYMTPVVAGGVFLAVKYNSGTSENEIWSIDKASGTETMLKSFAFPTNSWTSGSSYVDTTTGDLMLKAGNGTYLVFDPVAKEFRDPIAFGYSGYQKIFATSETLNSVIKSGVDSDGNPTTVVGTGSIVDATGDTIISTKDDADGNATTVIGSTNIVDTAGKTLIKTTTDGATHIGENSLVTIERNDVQQLYATNAGGGAIPINVTNGTRLQVNGVDVMHEIDRSMAISAAMSALPNSTGNSAGTCGVGSGFHHGQKALSAGCAMDFQSLLKDHDLPPAFDNATLNLATSAVANRRGFSNFTLRAGLSFDFGGPKASSSKPENTRKYNRRDIGTKDRFEALRNENARLSASVDTLSARLDALIAKIETQ